MELPALRLLLLLLLSSGLTVSQEDILPHEPIKVLVGKDLSIQTLLSKPAFTFIIWNFNSNGEQTHVATLGPAGLNVNDPYKSRGVNITTDGHLTVKALTPADNGQYSINVVDSKGSTKTGEIDVKVIVSQRHFSTLTVTSVHRSDWSGLCSAPCPTHDDTEERPLQPHKPISGVKMTGPSGKLFAGNSSANLSCEAAKGSVTQVVWLKDGSALSSRAVVAADQRSVLIDPLQKEDNGEYTCTMSNAASKESAKVKLMVICERPEPVQITAESEVEVTDRVVLDCSAASVPPANYTWKFNGTKQPITTSQYVIEKAVYSNTGIYTCEAYNALTGKTSSKTHTISVKAEGELDEGLSDGAIAGIVIGVLAAVAVAIGLFFYCRQKVPVASPY
ncbi:hypothetical protein WMY93_003233 [Mugilogobius chulae]|uniref:Ig-like domain-containing protein n=1 Tax=Mugilogobius chulae TaxID=88201 RepID=A0AAW0Q5V6_9GOBI